MHQFKYKEPVEYKIRASTLQHLTKDPKKKYIKITSAVGGERLTFTADYKQLYKLSVIVDNEGKECIHTTTVQELNADIPV